MLLCLNKNCIKAIMVVGGGLKQGITSRYINVCLGKEVIGVNVD